MSGGDMHALMRELYELLDVDPAAAVRKARSLSSEGRGDGLTIDSIRAGIFVDAALPLGDVELAREARMLLDRLRVAVPDRVDIQYNLANAISNECQLVPYVDDSWYIDTLQLRLAVRAAYQEVVDLRGADEFRARAQTNLGNELWRSHRWVEAYDAYADALNLDPSNVVASTGAVKVLLRARDLGIGDRRTAEAVAARHLRSVAGGRQRIRELAGEKAAAEFDRLQGLGLSGGGPPDLSGAGEYERFVAANRLMLTPTIEGLDVSLKRWDSLQIDRIIEATGTSAGVPPVFAIFNVAKAEYLAARWLFYLSHAEGSRVPETGAYHDTLDYAVYGVRSSLTVLAQRAALDVLDKIALLVTEFLALEDRPRDVTFRTRWHRRDKATKEIVGWHERIGEEIEKGNRGFIALADVAVDLSREGFLGRKKSLRDVGTHRALVLHDIANSPSRESAFVSHEDESEFHREVLETLRLTRASLLYLIEGLSLSANREEQKHPLLGPLWVPSHDWVRGQADENAGEEEDAGP